MKTNRFGSRKIKDGAGAGYSVKSELSNIKINNLELANNEEYMGTSVVSCNCDIDCDAKILNASSYYEGCDINVSVPCKITYIEVQLFYKQDIQDIFRVDDIDDIDLNNFNKESFEDYLSSLFYNGIIIETGIGSGYIHSKYNGEIANRDDSGKEYPSELISLDATISDEKMIEYIDRVVQGDNRSTSYDVYVNGEPEDSFDDESEAKKYAMDMYESSDEEIEVVMLSWIEDYDGNWNVEYQESIWSSTKYEEQFLDEYDDEDNY